MLLRVQQRTPANRLITQKDEMLTDSTNDRLSNYYTFDDTSVTQDDLDVSNEDSSPDEDFSTIPDVLPILPLP